MRRTVKHDLGLLVVGLAFAALAALAFWPRPKTPSTPATPAGPSEIAGYSTITAESPAVTAAVSATDLSVAQAKMGKDGAVKGVVSQVYIPDNRRATMLELSESPRDAITVIIEDDERPQFPKLDNLLGKRILAEGEFTEFQDRPNALKVTEPAKLKVITP